MAGNFGKIDVSAYGHQRMTARRVEALETAVANWLATKPGTFSSPDACGPYDKALVQFEAWSGLPGSRDAGEEFEVALARCGYRAGVVVFDGAPRWILVLPSSVDTALTRLVEAEVRPA